MECEKIFSNHISDKGIISRIEKELPQLKTKKQTAQFKDGQRDLPGGPVLKTPGS